jgi:hypothetical protein
VFPEDVSAPVKSAELAGSIVAPVRPPLPKVICGPLNAAVAKASDDVFWITSWLSRKYDVRPFCVSVNVVVGVTVLVPRLSSCDA